ncbi:unnamed protein product [Leptidea sinapis]|uniref:Nuclear nucleic acid-binding protein C1D n=1 Tax=Leptidea sinapis TaxID=189913 RepID=A0A5E4QCI1_9NEOP|nr:unnamed protein product [Leptidea sinapis]
MMAAGRESSLEKERSQNVVIKLLPLREPEIFEQLSLPAKIELELFFLFTYNALHWINLRIKGIDPATHPIKHEMDRIKAVMLEWQELRDRDKRPKLDLAAAKRFINSGLQHPHKTVEMPLNKKIKFSED